MKKGTMILIQIQDIFWYLWAIIRKFEPEKKAKMSAQMLAKEKEIKRAEQIINENEKIEKQEN